ncbi:hypothetical protein C882_3493 [Caenispirillum salinarum AK4]|uniref:Uncharacterized protein n=1 Tax=Caenispirillum salinarum AK4 TaxID=1238182 RepID=K9H2E8_9PROT|nr:hypothetical protein C882_3493 [Caenispirillum salinarum AK4]
MITRRAGAGAGGAGRALRPRRFRVRTAEGGVGIAALSCKVGPPQGAAETAVHDIDARRT